MSRSRLCCTACRSPLGYVNASGIFHRATGVVVIFIDFDRRLATLRCPCGATTEYSGRAINLLP